MKKLVTIMSLLSFVAMLGLGSALAQSDDESYATGCLKDKSKGASWKKIRTGLDAGKCSNPEITLVQKALTDSLGDQIDDLDEAIFLLDEDLQEQIDDNADKGQENMDRIDALVAGGISSMFGGGHLTNTDLGENATFYFPMTSSQMANATEAFAQAKLAATGWITKIAVNTNIGPGADNDLIFIPRLQKPGEVAMNAFLNPLIGQQCVISGGQTMCESQGCRKVDMGDLLALQLTVIKSGAGDALIRPARVTARFVETEEDCPPLVD